MKHLLFTVIVGHISLSNKINWSVFNSWQASSLIRVWRLLWNLNSLGSATGGSYLSAQKTSRLMMRGWWQDDEDDVRTMTGWWKDDDRMRMMRGWWRWEDEDDEEDVRMMTGWQDDDRMMSGWWRWREYVCVGTSLCHFMCLYVHNI